MPKIQKKTKSSNVLKFSFTQTLTDVRHKYSQAGCKSTQVLTDHEQHTKLQVYKNAKAKNVYHRCWCFIFDKISRYGKKINNFKKARRDEPLRTSAWEANMLLISIQLKETFLAITAVETAQ